MYANKRAAIAALGLGLSLAAGVAQGALLSFQDDDIDFILNPNLTLKTSGALAVGDLFVSVLEVPTFTIDGVNAIPAGQQMTGVAAIRLNQIIGTGVGAQYMLRGCTRRVEFHPCVGDGSGPGCSSRRGRPGRGYRLVA